MRALLTYIFTVFAVYLIQAQPNSNWYYGFERGFKFVNQGIIIDTESIQSASENAVSLSNQESQLLFYSNGERIWDRNNALMSNGDSLFGSSSAYQGIVTFNLPSNEERYFLFYTSSFENFLTGDMDFSYSIIDMTLNGGLGDVDTNYKNVVLQDTLFSEQVTATYGRGTNQGSVWVVAYIDSNRIVTYKVDNSGVNFFNTYLFGDKAVNGSLSFSSNGNYFVYASYRFTGGYIPGITISKFDPALGLLNEPIFIPTNATVTSSEFSPNEDFLYLAGYRSDSGLVSSFILVLDLEVHDSLSIIQSIDSLFSKTDTIPWAFTDMELAPDGKIYLQRLQEQDTLASISNPNQISGGVNFTLNDLYTGTLNTSEHASLPEFLALPYHYVDIRNLCLGDTTVLETGPYADSVLWNFGDPGSGANNIDSGSVVEHIFTDTGTYTVTTIVYDYLRDTIKTIFHIYNVPHGIDEDTLNLCQGEPYLPSNYSSHNQYIWNDSLLQDSLTPKYSGWHKLKVSNPCDTIQDSVFIQIELPIDHKLNDTTLCEGDTSTLSSGVNFGASFTWSTGSTTPSIAAGNWLSPNLDPFDVWLIASNACGSDTDSMVLNFIPLPDASLPDDTVQCFDAPIPLRHAGQDSTAYLWFDGSTGTEVIIESDTTVWLQATNICGTVSDTMRVAFHPEIKVELGEDTMLCPGDSVVLDVSWPGSAYLWNTVPAGYSEQDSVISVYYDDITGNEQAYLVTITNGPCSLVESRILMIEESCDSVDCKFAVPNVFSPNGDGINDVLRISNTCKNLSFSVFIYNRWGQLVFYDKHATIVPGGTPAVRWDGRINGTVASEGTYFIVVQYDEKKVHKTVVTLVR